MGILYVYTETEKIDRDWSLKPTLVALNDASIKT